MNVININIGSDGCIRHPLNNLTFHRGQMSKIIYKVYKITNLINNKFYIGITQKLLNHRFAIHKNVKSYIGNSIRKYGENNFTIEQIDTAKTYNQLRKKEISYIDKLKPFYNLTKGGDGLFGFKHSKNTKKLISLKMAGRKLTEEHKKKLSENSSSRRPEVKSKISLSLTGLNHPMWGKKHSDETKRKMKIAWKLRKINA